MTGTGSEFEMRAAGREALTVFWVVGSDTNVGKTTIASALVRVLNRNGLPSVGFKPFAGGLLRDLYDLMVNEYPRSECKLFGGDALKLAKASPLTATGSVDLVGPVQYLHHPNWGDALMARVGAVANADAMYFKSDRLSAVERRADFQALIRASGLPAVSASRVDALQFIDAPRLAGPRVAAAYARLRSLGPVAIVCEGAAGFLPAWHGCPAVNHLLAISAGTVRLFAHIDMAMSIDPDAPLQTLSRLAEGARACRNQVAVPLFVTGTAARDPLAERIVASLLARTKLQMRP